MGGISKMENPKTALLIELIIKLTIFGQKKEL